MSTAGLWTRVEPARLGPGGAAELVPTLDRWLRPESPWSLSDEFPLVFGPRARAHHHVLRDGGRLVAHAAVLPTEVSVHGERARVELVGSVVVSPDERGRGLGSLLMENVGADFNAGDATLCLLWSDKPAFYAKHGFAGFGHDRYLVLRPGAPIPRGLVRGCHPSEMAALHASKPVRALRSASEFDALCAIPEMQRFGLRAAGELRAYACLGKGLDFGGVIHEYGGEDAHVAALLAALPSLAGGELACLLPPWRSEVEERLEPSVRLAEDCPLGLALVKRAAPEGFYLEGLDSI